MSAQTARRLGLELEKLNSQAVLANNQNINSKHHTKCHVAVPELVNKEKQIEFLILESSHYEAIFGLNLLKNLKIRIDLAEMKLSSEEGCLKLEKAEYYDALATPEQELLSKTRLAAVSIQDKTAKLIEKYKQEIPEPGLIPNRIFSLNLTDSSLIRLNPHPIPYRFYDEVKSEVRRLPNIGIIRPGYSRFGSTAFAIKKKNGELRLVVDYRKLNEKLDDSAYPFPEMWDKIRSIPPSQVFFAIGHDNGLP